MARVHIRNVDKRFGNVPIIENLSLEILDEEFMVLVGPSGCGKSTVLRMIAGLEDVSSGTIEIGDRVVNELAPRDRDIAMVFQNYALYPHMTVRENLAFGLKIRRLPRPEIDRQVNEAAEILGIPTLLDRKPKQLSGGQRQRVALGRAIVRSPSVFLFDEPLSNLDAKLRVQMRAEISKLQQRLRTTCVYVTHDQVEAMTMGHRIAVLRDGKLQQAGAPLEVYQHPENLFVANFIGTPPMNFLSARVSGGGSRLLVHGIEIPVPSALQQAIRSSEGERIIIGIRPENIIHPSETARGATARITTQVEIVEPLGYQVIVHSRIGDDLLVSPLDPHHAPKMGESLELLIELDSVHLFDAKSEQRLRA
ncbi:MAG TPA: sn-glycerol-3-phosphate ABC transporter ATP-binding protein UgpC [Thermoanaerobaculia bacterium]|nr:sn-glycerol-3-phosphate ABC transporter ATP-binding protein UgpC [Thermoanaerobaculia bacterium]